MEARPSVSSAAAATNPPKLVSRRPLHLLLLGLRWPLANPQTRRRGRRRNHPRRWRERPRRVQRRIVYYFKNGIWRVARDGGTPDSLSRHGRKPVGQLGAGRRRLLPSQVPGASRTLHHPVLRIRDPQRPRCHHPGTAPGPVVASPRRLPRPPRTPLRPTRSGRRRYPPSRKFR